MRALSLSFLSLLLATATARAEATPVALTHSGRLLDASDQPVESSALNLKFKLYNVRNPGDATESLVWQSSACNVRISRGIYSVVLGGDACNGTTPLDSSHFPFGAPRFLEVSIEDTPMLPRMSFQAVPNAHTAAMALDSNKLGGQTLAQLDDRYARLKAGGSTQQGDLAISGTVAAGKLAGDGAALTNLDAGKLAAGTVPDARLSGTYSGALSLTNPANVLAGIGSSLTDLDASKLAAGTVPDTRLSGTYSQPLTFSSTGNTFVGNGAGLSSLDAGALATGTIPDARLSGAYANPLTLSNAANAISGVGTGLTALNASNLGSGTLPDGRLSGTYSQPLVFGKAKISGVLDAPNNLEVVQVEDPRLVYTPSNVGCGAGEWCGEPNAWGGNRFATNGRYTGCSDDADCSANKVELVLNANQYRSVLLSDLDWSNSRSVLVYVSFDGGANYTYHRSISTFRLTTQSPYVSRIRTVVTNLPLGANVRVRLVAAKGRFHFEGLGLSKMVLPEEISEPLRTATRVSGNGADATCDGARTCAPSALAARKVSFVKTLAETGIRVQYTDAMRSYGSDGTPRACQWSVYFDGAPCPSNPIIGAVYSGGTGPSADPHHVRTITGTCFGLTAGTHTVQAYVQSAPTYQGYCSTGWNSSFYLEAEEVQ